MRARGYGDPRARMMGREGCRIEVLGRSLDPGVALDPTKHVGEIGSRRVRHGSTRLSLAAR
jgi:hypothetical protein